MPEEPAESSSPPPSGALGKVRASAGGALRRVRLPSRAESKKDALAGLINGVVGIPDGLASAGLVGVNPVYGLYANIFARLGAAPFLSSQIMQIGTTSASALAAAEAISYVSDADRVEALFLLVVLIGAFQVLFGLLRFGQLTRFVSHSVMTGFLLGVAVLLILGQLAPLVGHDPEGDGSVEKAADTVTSPGQFSGATIVIGLIALVVLIGLGRTRFRNAGAIVALALPTLVVAVLALDSVRLVGDVSDIPRGLPAPDFPAISNLDVNIVGSAAAIAAIIVVQGAGVSLSFSNRDGSTGDSSRDFIAQGAGNVASGVFSGIPAGGSVGSTALNASTGAQTRWSVVFAAFWVLAFILLFPALVEQIPSSALAALMIMAGLGAINIPEARSIWSTGWVSRLPILITFVATLFLPIPIAVGVGVITTVILFLASASDVEVSELVEDEDGNVIEREPPVQLRPRAVTVLEVNGSLFFAGARLFGRRVPPPLPDSQPAVVLRLRGHTAIGATFIEVLRRYAADIVAAGGRLYITGTSAAVQEQIGATGKLDFGSDVVIVPATSLLGEATRSAVADAEAWLPGRHGSEETP